MWDAIAEVSYSIIAVAMSLAQVALVAVIVVILVRRSKRGTGPQIATLEQMDAADPAVGTRFRAVAPDESFLLAIPARLQRSVGWLIASSRRIWWISAPGRSNAQEAEYGYDLLANVVGGSPFTLPVLSIGTVLFRVSRENGEAISRIIRQQRDIAAPKLVPVTGDIASPAKLGVADELAKFAAMRDSGVLTDEEFEKAKRELLG